MCQAFLVETVETGTKNRCMIEFSHTCLAKINCRAFPKCVIPPILSLQSIDYPATSEHYWVVKKKKES